MGLLKYLRKRDFSNTPEPKGPNRASSSKKLIFVVQEHHASRLHYDFRLELDGVLKSWAIPKGPSMNPHEHHLAVQTEDHPYDYRRFEGVIPEGNYGAGNVIIWDEGWYEARAGDAKRQIAILRSELKKGHLTFVLHGSKLQGEFALIKLKNSPDKKAWLLVKKGDHYATTADVTEQDESVKTHRRVDELGAHNKLPDLSEYPRRVRPWKVKPMLCTLVDAPFNKIGWSFEIKWDGYRAIGVKHGHALELYSRLGNDFVAKFPPVAEALRDFKYDCIVDGEIVVVDDEGVSHFEWLQNWHREPQGTLRYYIFDILWCAGRDIRKMPFKERKQLLSVILPRSDVLRLSDAVETDGVKLFEEIRRRHLEGIVAKRADSLYREDDRGQDWLKIKTGLRQEVVIGGYTEPRGGRKYIGSLLVGVYEKGVFTYVGHSGGGIPDSERKALLQSLRRLERRTSAFDHEPKPNAPVHWVRPELICEMSFSEWTKEGYMRQPKFEGLRPDKQPENVHREKVKTDTPIASAKPSTISAIEPFERTHTDKLFFPKHKYTKGDIFAYYESVADFILPYLKDRACSMKRMPNGIAGESFFQKDNPHLPDWVPHVDIFSESDNRNLRWIKADTLETLLYMVQLGCVEINPWNSRSASLDKPDWIVIDLDPEGVTFDMVISVARTVKEICDEWHIPAYPKTSGQTGLHIYIPMHARYSYEQGKNIAHLLALEVNKRQPTLTSVERMPEKRKHKIYVDFLQNREGQTLAAPYSLRPTPDATVSMPLHWDELKHGLEPGNFTITNARRRLSNTGDLWKPILGKGVDLTELLRRVDRAAQTQ